MFIHEIRTTNRTWRFEDTTEEKVISEREIIRKANPHKVIVHARLSRFLNAVHGLVEVKAWDEHFPPLHP